MIEPLPQLLLSSQLLNILPVFRCFFCFFTSLQHVLKNHHELSTNKKTVSRFKIKEEKLKKETVLNVQKSDAIYTSQLVSTFTTIGM